MLVVLLTVALQVLLLVLGYLVLEGLCLLSPVRAQFSLAVVLLSLAVHLSWRPALVGQSLLWAARLPLLREARFKLREVLQPPAVVAKLCYAAALVALVPLDPQLSRQLLLLSPLEQFS